MARLRRERTLRARELRRAATPAESHLWALLRGRRLLGAKFRRQQPVGPFIVDFLCAEAGLVVEADGAGHFPPSAAQLQRDALLEAAGFRVLRFENRIILSDPSSLLRSIASHLAAHLPPLPPGEGAGGEGD